MEISIVYSIVLILDFTGVVQYYYINLNYPYLLIRT